MDAIWITLIVEVVSVMLAVGIAIGYVKRELKHLSEDFAELKHDFKEHDRNGVQVQKDLAVLKSHHSNGHREK